MEQTQEFRIAILERDQIDLRKVVESIDGSLSALVRLETHHTETRAGLDRAFKAIKAVEEEQDEQDSRLAAVEKAIPLNFDERFRAIETAMPGLKETRKWVITGVLGICAVVGMAILGVVIIKDARQPATAQPVISREPAVEQKPIPHEMRR